MTIRNINTAGLGSLLRYWFQCKGASCSALRRTVPHPSQEVLSCRRDGRGAPALPCQIPLRRPLGRMGASDVR
jgi:hypothetical protein